MAPTDTGNTSEIQQELQKLLDRLRVRSKSLKADADGSFDIGTMTSGGLKVASVEKANSGGGSGGKRYPADGLLAMPVGAKRASQSLSADRVPEIILLRTTEEIDEKGIKDKAAKLYRDIGAGTLFINMQYPSIDAMREQLELEYASTSDPDHMRRMAQEEAEKAIISRVGRAVVFALAKQVNKGWVQNDIEHAHSPESLSIVADDFWDSMQNARRRMGKALRVSRGELEPQL